MNKLPVDCGCCLGSVITNVAPVTLSGSSGSCRMRDKVLLRAFPCASERKQPLGLASHAPNIPICLSLLTQ